MCVQIGKKLTLNGHGSRVLFAEWSEMYLKCQLSEPVSMDKLPFDLWEESPSSRQSVWAAHCLLLLAFGFSPKKQGIKVQFGL